MTVISLNRKSPMGSGLFVAILGPDGSGKSTLADNLACACEGSFVSVRRHHVRPRLFGHRDTPDLSPHSHGSAGPLRSLLKLAFLALDYTLGYRMVTRPALSAGALCIADRYFHDLLVDPARYRCRPPRWLVKTLIRLMPRPDLVLVLVAPPHLVAARKGELGVDEIVRQTTAYASLAATDPTVHLLDAARPPPEVAAMASHLVASCRRHHAPMVGAGAQAVS